MGKSLNEVMAALPANRQDKIRARGAALVADEMTLRELRKAMGTTQEQLAARMGKPQATISRMEAQSDMLMSTLGQVVEGMGGRLSIVAEMPGRAPVRLGTGPAAQGGSGRQGCLPSRQGRAHEAQRVSERASASMHHRINASIPARLHPCGR